MQYITTFLGIVGCVSGIIGIFTFISSPPKTTARRTSVFGIILAGMLIMSFVLARLSDAGASQNRSQVTPSITTTTLSGSSPTKSTTLSTPSQEVPTPTIPMPTPTISLTPSPQELYTQSTNGNPVLDDPLNGRDANGWDEVNIANYSCTFTAGAYYVSIQQQSYFESCFARATNYSDFAFQADMTIISGDGGGLLFRAGNPDRNGYRFFLGISYFDLSYGNQTLRRSNTIQASLNRTYLLTAIVEGSSIYLYIDKQWLATIEDAHTSSGMIGFMAVDFIQPAEVAFSHAQVWIL